MTWYTGRDVMTCYTCRFIDVMTWYTGREVMMWFTGRFIETL